MDSESRERIMAKIRRMNHLRRARKARELAEVAIESRALVDLRLAFIMWPYLGYPHRFILLDALREARQNTYVLVCEELDRKPDAFVFL